MKTPNSMATSSLQPSFSSRCWRWWCGWPSDVCLWAGVILLVILALLWWRGHLRIIDPNFGPQRLLLHSSDANDVKPGSNVYFMGVLVGTIEEVRIPFNTRRYDVAMVANTHRELPTLPDNIEGYIVFSGLAGAKEVHLVPPKNPVWTPHSRRSQQFINIENPLRLRDVMHAQMEVNAYLELGAESFSNLLSQGGKTQNVTEQIALMQRNIDRANTLGLKATHQTERLIGFFDRLHPILHNTLTRTNQTLLPISGYTARAQQALDITINQHPLASAQATLHNTHTTVQQARQQLDNLNNQLGTLQPSLNALQHNLALFNLQGGVQPIPSKLKATHGQLQHFRLWLEHHLPHATFLTDDEPQSPQKSTTP